MAAITIGAPVYNGEADLAESLEGLRAQTFSDFEVIIYDNASDDRTPEIAADVMSRDRRFRYVRQPCNKGPMANFRDVLEAADSPCFLWRAADDRSAPNFLETLHGLLEAHPDKSLAVGVVTRVRDGAVVRRFAPPRLRAPGDWGGRRAALFGSHESWIYGLFRTEALRAVMRRAMPDYGDNPNAFDNLVLLPFLLDGAVAASEATEFFQALRPRRDPSGPRAAVDLDEILARRRRFLDIGRGFVDERFAPGAAQLWGWVLLQLYANRAGFRLTKIGRRLLRRRLGLRP